MCKQSSATLKILIASFAGLSLQMPNICHSQIAHIESSDQSSHRLEKSDLFPSGSADSSAALSDLLLNTRNDQATFLLEDHDHESALATLYSDLFDQRISLGLKSKKVLPILNDISQLQLILGDWESSADTIEHARFITASNYGLDSIETLFILEKQATLRILEFYSGLDQRQPKIFLHARDILSEAATIASTLALEKGPEIYPWYYKRALNLARLVGFIYSSEDILSGDFTNDLIKHDGPIRVYGTSRFNNMIGEGYLRLAAEHIKSIYNFAHDLNDTEAKGLAEIYQGDFKLLSGSISSKRHYERGLQLLREAGVEQEKIDRIFLKPTPIPIPQFFSNVDELLSYQDSQFNPVNSAEQTQVLQILDDWYRKMQEFFGRNHSYILSELELSLKDIELTANVSQSGKVSFQSSARSQFAENIFDPSSLRSLSVIKIRPSFSDGKFYPIKDLNIRYSFITAK